MAFTRRDVLWFTGSAVACPVMYGLVQDKDILDLPNTDVTSIRAVESLKTALELRKAGVLILERRCWEVVREIDGRAYGKGCGSYFRWLYPVSSQCPFCGTAWPTVLISVRSAEFVMSEFYPLTLNYTGERGRLNEFEIPVVEHEPGDEGTI